MALRNKKEIRHFKTGIFDKPAFYILGSVTLLILIAVLIYFMVQHTVYSLKHAPEIKEPNADCEIYRSPGEKDYACVAAKRAEIAEYWSKYKTAEECEIARKKNLCIMVIAKFTKNASVCGAEIGGYKEKDLCYFWMAFYLRNESICSLIGDSYCAGDCEDIVSFAEKSDKENANPIISTPCNQDTNETFCVFQPFC
ncbi:hypothetical protein A3K73_02340 [Candidatus Pacearchaeota archaeon RBG_13_36_9]|nr:MAG: hypothetical protein A3K73_02340 [Candidatus Pacearchaeota archaeon RBG_13_36_9]